ncbi:hypothetical protein ACWKSP_16660 [Micromonosporaceae bacterium Da 78-11]
MTSSSPDQPHASADQPERSMEDVMWGRVDRKRERIRSEIRRNRAGGHRIPTWALAVILGLILLAWLYLILTS